MLFRSLLLAPLAAVALAAPASASTPIVYNVAAVTHVSGTATGTDGDGWDSNSTFDADVKAVIHDISSTDDAGTVTATAPSVEVTGTQLTQHYSLVTVLETITWDCTQDGEAHIAPGSFKLVRDNGTDYVTMTVGQAITASRDCTGFSAFTGDISIGTKPLTVAFSFPDSELAGGSYTKSIDVIVPCGDWTVNQTKCAAHMAGAINIRRGAATPTADADDQAQPDPTPAPTDTDDDVSSPPRPPTPIKAVKGKWLHGEKGAKLKVQCYHACKGTVSAEAVARGHRQAKGLGMKSFDDSDGGTQNITIMFGKSGSRTARQRGAVIFDVTSEGQMKTFRLNTH